MSADDEKPPLDAALRHLAEQQRRALTSHPTPQELAAYHAGELPPEAEARILDHLAICRECSDLLLDLSGFADLKPPAGVPELTDEQVEQDWQALRSKMREGEGGREEERKPAPVVPIRPAVTEARLARWSSPLLPVAASLLAVLGFSFGLYKDWQMRQFSRMQVDPLTIELAETTRSAGEEVSAVARPGQSFNITFEVIPSEERSYSGYEVEHTGPKGDVERRPANKGAVEDSGELMIQFRAGLPAGEHTIRVYGLAGGQEEVLKEHTFTVR